MKGILTPRERTRLRQRKKISGLDIKPRLSVFKSSKHMYAQLISDEKSTTVAAASTRDKEVVAKLKDLEGGKDSSTKSVLAARAVGMVLAEKAKSKGLDACVFDRGGFKYHGRIKSVADGAREGGLKF